MLKRCYEKYTSMSPPQNTTEEPETFEFQSGVATIDGEEINFDLSVVKGFKQVYEHSTLVFLLLIALFASGIAIMTFFQRFYIVAIRDAIIAFVLLFSIYLILRRLGVRFGVIGDATVIPLDSVKRAEYKDIDKWNYSRLYIIYEKNGSEKRQTLAMSQPIIGGSGRLESAIEALNNKGIKTSSV